MKNELECPEGLYKITSRDITRCAEVMSDAFVNDPLVNYLMGNKNFPNEKYNTKKAVLFFKNSIASIADKALIYSLDSNLNSIAIWLPYGYSRVSTIKFLLNGGLKMPFVYDVNIIMRMKKYEDFQYLKKKHNIGNNCLYLFMLGVETKEQGNKLSSKLIRPILKFAEVNNYNIYLETHTKKNSEMYVHYGFECAEECVLPNTNITQYCMRIKRN